MAGSLWGMKVGMTRIWEGDRAVGVTVIQVLPNEVVEVKTRARHGYDALKVAVGPKRRKPSKPIAGEFKKADVAPRRFLREIPVVPGKELGAKVTIADVLAAGATVDVTATSKGHGFAGVMKRHNFSGHCQSHGVQKHRGPGSIGCRMDPGRVFKNKRMAGHWGDEQVTVRNLTIAAIDADEHLVLVRGSVPGANGGLVSIRQA